MTKRNIQIDTLRGIACILLVAYHVVGNPNLGLRIDHGFYRDVSDILAYIRMPIFTFLSGVVYAYRPFSENARQYIKGKLRRLILPMLIVGTLFVIVQSMDSGTNSSAVEWHLLHIKPVGHFWFVEAIFLIFLLMIPLEIIGALNSMKRSLLVLMIASMLYVSNVSFEYFSVTGAIYLLPYFLIGLILQRFLIIDYLNLKSGVILIVGLVILLALVLHDILTVESKRTLLALTLGTIACVGLLSIKLKSMVLSKIGQFSYTIYIYHVFFTAGARVILNKLGVHDINILFFVSLTSGIIAPILIECFFNGTNFTRVFLLGKSKVDIHDLWLTNYFSRKIHSLRQ